MSVQDDIELAEKTAATMGDTAAMATLSEIKKIRETAEEDIKRGVTRYDVALSMQAKIDAVSTAYTDARKKYVDNLDRELSQKERNWQDMQRRDFGGGQQSAKLKEYEIQYKALPTAELEKIVGKMRVTPDEGLFMEDPRRFEMAASVLRERGKEGEQLADSLMSSLVKRNYREPYKLTPEYGMTKSVKDYLATPHSGKVRVYGGVELDIKQALSLPGENMNGRR